MTHILPSLPPVCDRAAWAWGPTALCVPQSHPLGHTASKPSNTPQREVPPLQVNTGSAGVALLGIYDVYACVCLFSLKFYTGSGGGRGCWLLPLSCVVPRGLAASLCSPSGFVPTAAALQGVV